MAMHLRRIKGKCHIYILIENFENKEEIKRLFPYETTNTESHLSPSFLQIGLKLKNLVNFNVYSCFSL